MDLKENRTRTEQDRNSAATSPPWRFGAFVLDRSTRRLLRDGHVVPLARRPFDVLEYLVAQRPRLVPRSELLAEFWGGRDVYEESLTRCLSSVRKALDDREDPAQLIETRWNEGYRFIGEVTLETAGATPIAAPAPLDASEVTPDASVRRRTPSGAWVALAGAFIALLVATAMLLRPAGTDDPIRRIAMLPLSGDASEQWLADGLADELTHALSRIEGLTLIARASAQRARDADEDPVRMGRQLKVDALLEGRLRAVDQGHALMMRLVSARDGAVLWSHEDTYSEPELVASASQIATRLGVRLSARLRTTSVSQPISGEAYATYLRARYQWNLRTAASLREARRLYEQVLATEPGFADAWAGLAECWLLMPLYASDAPFEAHPQARRAAERALALDPAHSRALAVLGVVSSQFEWNWTAADDYFLRAIQLDPNNATAQQWLAEAYCYRRRFEECARHMKEALALDPLSPILATASALHARFSGQHEIARRNHEAVLKTYPTFSFAEYQLGLIASAAGDWTTAARHLEHVLPVFGPVLGGAPLGFVYARAGRVAEARAIEADLQRLSATQYVPPLAFSDIAMGFGDYALAKKWLQRAETVHDDFLVTIGVDHHHRELHGDPQFEALLRRLGLPPSPAPDRSGR